MKGNSTNQRLVGGVWMLLVGNGFGQLCAFLRTVIVARYLKPEDFGIAAMLSITVAILDLVGFCGLEQLIISHENGDDERLQSTAQQINLARSLLACLIIFSLAAPLANCFGVPSASSAFRWLGILVFLRGFLHFDIHRLKRKMDFVPEVAVGIAANVLSLLATWPLAFWLRDFTAMLWILVLRGVVEVGTSHLFSRRRFSVVFDTLYFREILKFGWPLQVNALLIFLLYQGDRLVVAAAPKLSSALSLFDLGLYSAAFSLAAAPTLLLAKLGGTMVLPYIQGGKHCQKQFQKRYELVSQLSALAVGVLCLTYVVLEKQLIIWTYGNQYLSGTHVLAWLALMQGVRLLRSTPLNAAISCGDTKNAMYSNIFRCIGFILTWVIVLFGGGLSCIAVVGFFAESASFCYSIYRVKKSQNLGILSCLLPIGIPMVCCGVGFATVVCCKIVSELVLLPLWTALMSVLFISMFVMFPYLRNAIRQFVSLTISKAKSKIIFSYAKYGI